MKIDNAAYLLAKAEFDQTCDLEKAISTYLSTEGEVCTPFDPTLVKPGDEVRVDEVFKGYYIGMNRCGLVCVEVSHRPLGHALYRPSSITIPPKPKKTLKVWVYRRVLEGKPYYCAYFEPVVSPGFMLVSDGAEVEVSE